MTDILITNAFQLLGTSIRTSATYYDANYADHASWLPNANSKIFDVDENDFWIQFTMYRTYQGYLAGSADAFYFYFTSGDIWCSLPIVSGIQKFRYRAAPGGASTTVEVTIPSMTVTTIDIHIIKDNGDGTATFDLYVDGSLLNAYTGTRGGGTVSGKFMIGSPGTWGNQGEGGGYISNLHISTSSTLNTRFRSIPVDTVGTYNMFVGGGFDGLVDGAPLTFAWSDTAAQRVSGTIDHTLIPTGVGTITSVAVTTITQPQGPSVSPNSLAHFVRSGTTNYDQTPVTPAAGSNPMVTEMVNNPATASAWETADFNGIEFGLVSSHV